MKISDLAKLVKGKILSCESNISNEVTKAFSCDLMSDVLTINTDNLVLLTGLANTQTIRTAEMQDIACIVIVRNKKCNEEMISLATEAKIVLIESAFSMYRVAGILYSAGLEPVY